jgi:hypothetical protein
MTSNKIPSFDLWKLLKPFPNADCDEEKFFYRFNGHMRIYSARIRDNGTFNKPVPRSMMYMVKKLESYNKLKKISK